MSASDRSWPGAKWWKFDFHAHTPASSDYGKGPDQAALKTRAPRDWLLDYMRADVDCVAVTDHNSGGWIDRLVTALTELEADKPEGYRPLVLFPGVEISVNGGTHLLAILDPSKRGSDIDSLLGAVGFPGTKGHSDGVTTLSLVQVVAAIREAGGIAVPAHVDQKSGLLEVTGQSLLQVLDCGGIEAMEVVDPGVAKPQLFVDRKLSWAEVLGSDAHHPPGAGGPRFPGSHFTWVKMGEPTLDGLRLALLDGAPLSVRRSDVEKGNPNDHSHLIIESIEVSRARYMGRQSPLRVALSPWLTSLIGGRGTGKSSLVEFLRIVLRRRGEIPDALQGDLDKYEKVYQERDGDGLLCGDASLTAVYRKDGTRFRLQWSPAGNLEPIQQETEGGSWAPTGGDIPQRFPVRIFSQKQVFHLAKAPSALLRVVDDAPEVGRRTLDEQRAEEEARYLSLRARARELQAGLAEETRLRGELEDIGRKLAVFEKAGHADVLKRFQRCRRQERAVETWEETWSGAGARIRELSGELVPDPLDAAVLDAGEAEDASLVGLAESTRLRLDSIRAALVVLSEEADAVVTDWQAGRDASEWKRQVEEAVGAYEALQQALALEGAGDPSAYGQLVQQRQTVEQRLKDLAERGKQVDSIHKQADEGLARIAELRRELTRRRDQFLRGVLQGNRFVSIEVVAYGAEEEIERQVREGLGLPPGRFEKDLGTTAGEGLLGSIYASGRGAASIESGVGRLKRELRALASGDLQAPPVRDQRFASHMSKQSPESLDRFDLWFPDDSLEVKYCAAANGREFRSIEEGSPGQKTAALLAFLLSYGDEPLVLDQPEDDLDNHLIYDLIVRQLREIKHRRQLIVVTHNPNIVVNGDAELVVALEVKAGQTHIECEGSLQDRKLRETVCLVMEGGSEAFTRRWQRLALEGSRV